MKLDFPKLVLATLAALGVLVLLLYWESLPSWSRGDNSRPLRVYCAAGLRDAFEAAAGDYQREFGVAVQADYDGSGALLSKMRADGRGDLFLAASETYIDDARNFDLIREVTPLAHQRPVLVVAKGNPLDVRTLADCLRPGVRVSLANPKVAAISRDAQRRLAGVEVAGKPLWEALWAAKLVSRDTVNAVANDVRGGAADAGIVWDATASQYPELLALPSPEFQGPPNLLSMAVLSSADPPAAALRFLRYVSARDKGLRRFEERGYEVVEGDLWADKPRLTVFAGGVTRPAVRQLFRDFEQREGVTIVDSYNGCGVLVGQIKTGAAPDLYFACETRFLDSVAEHFGDAVVVSSTRLVIITAKGRAEALGVASAADLAKPGLRVGVCHPAKSALGDLTRRLLESQGLVDAVQANVKDTPATADRLVEHVVFGSLDAAVAFEASTVLQADKLDVLPIRAAGGGALPPTVQLSAEQPIAVSKKSDHRRLTQRLLERVRSAESRAAFEKLGFQWRGETSAP